jgi:SAM-dependent MidA family methyltransferase
VTNPRPPAPLAQHLIERVRRHGPLPFSAVMETALYDSEHGFFAAGSGAVGRRGDFITSPEVGPLFGAVLAQGLDTWWDELGQPDPFVVVEAGAGVGTLAVSIIAARPRCAGALHYVLVERSPVFRSHHGDHLPLAPPATSLGVAGAGDGPVVVSLADMPASSFTGVILANELLDNLAFDLLTRTEEGWSELRVGTDDADHPTRLVRHVVPASATAMAAGERLAPDAAIGAVIPWEREATSWVRDALALVERGRLVIVDYGVDHTAELAARPMGEWLRTYRDHDMAGDPLDSVGSTDITVEVCVDQLSLLAGPPTSVRTQADALRAFGIASLVEEGRRVWAERAHIGDLEAIKGRSRIVEAEALLDPAGLGGFLLIEWVRGVTEITH